MVQAKRVYVASDVHNNFDKLRGLLEKIRFNKNEDALFLLGDLFDRGPDPLACYDLVRKYQAQEMSDLSPGIHCVRGNHDDWLMRNLAIHLDGQRTFSAFNTLEILISEASNEKKLKIMRWIMSLPYQIELEFDSPYGKKQYLLAHGITTLPEEKEMRDARYFIMADDLDFTFIKQGIPGYVSLIGHNLTDNIREWMGEDEHPVQPEIYFNRRQDPSVIALDCGCGLNNLGRKRKGRLACIRLNDYRCFYV